MRSTNACSSTEPSSANGVTIAVSISPKPDIAAQYPTGPACFAGRVPLTPEELHARYAGQATLVRRGGRAHPAAFAPMAELAVQRVPARVSSGLRRAAAPFLDAA